MLWNKKIYECELCSICPSTNIYKDLSMSQNIKNAETECVRTIMVQRTSNKHYFKEIITGKLIPAYYIRTKELFYIADEWTLYSPPNSPIFIEYKFYVDPIYFKEFDLKTPTYKDLKEYIEKYKDRKEEYLKELNKDFEDAWNIYNTALAKGEYSDKYKAKKLGKSLKK